MVRWGLQSAHREFHGTVFNSIAFANDNQESVIFLLLDLSAAFDTAEIDRQIDSLFTFKNLQPRAELR